MMGAGLCLLLPETMGKPLPHTLEDGELYGEGEGMLEFMCWKAKEEAEDNRPQ
jgi:hypothetical protein